MKLKGISINTSNCVDSALDRDYWRVLVNAALNLRIPLAIQLVKPTGKRSLRRPRCKWEDYIRMDLKEISINTSNCVDSALDRDYWRVIVNAALNLHKPWNCIVLYCIEGVVIAAQSTATFSRSITLPRI
jgi:hypothetical protein